MANIASRTILLDNSSLINPKHTAKNVIIAVAIIIVIIIPVDKCMFFLLALCLKILKIMDNYSVIEVPGS